MSKKKFPRYTVKEQKQAAKRMERDYGPSSKATADDARPAYLGQMPAASTAMQPPASEIEAIVSDQREHGATRSDAYASDMSREALRIIESQPHAPRLAPVPTSGGMNSTPMPSSMPSTATMRALAGQILADSVSPRRR